MVDKSKVSLPIPTPETMHFWQGTSQQPLRLQRCDDCKHVYFPPRPFCPSCGSCSIQIFNASGKGTLYSYVINHRPHPAFEGPYSIAVITLEEGPRMMTNIVNCPQTPEVLELDMSVEVVFEEMSAEISLPYFQPARTSS